MESEVPDLSSVPIWRFCSYRRVSGLLAGILVRIYLPLQPLIGTIDFSSWQFDWDSEHLALSWVWMKQQTLQEQQGGEQTTASCFVEFGIEMLRTNVSVILIDRENWSFDKQRVMMQSIEIDPFSFRSCCHNKVRTRAKAPTWRLIRRPLFFTSAFWLIWKKL